MKKIESGITYNDRSFEIGSKYIWSISASLGKSDEKRILTKEGKEAAKRLIETTSYGDLDRYNGMTRIWNDFELSREELE
jgi:hypothetical protein